jgi:hypothetical protein
MQCSTNSQLRSVLSPRVNPKVADLLRRAAQARVPRALQPQGVGSEAYFTVREILAEASTAADGVLEREPNDFCRCGFATLGLSSPPIFCTKVNSS